jgi:heme-degrading monooxygenase HmoA
MIASITKMRLKSVFKLPKFMFVSGSVFKQVKNAPGNKGVKSTNKGLQFFTLTLWEDERSIMDFMLSGAHREVMKVIRDYSDDYGSARWEVSEMPPWDEAHTQLNSK